MGLNHCVITSVDRDDLIDGGASFWANVISTIRSLNPGTTIEALIPDFDGEHENLDKIINANPDLISHNVETVRRLTPKIRTRAKYDRSLGQVRVYARAWRSGAGDT
jgi:lipoic acid synthetase